MKRIIVWSLLVLAGGAIACTYYWPEYERYRLWSTAQSAQTAGNLALADDSLAKLCKLEPENARAHLLYARVLREMGRAGDAEFHLSRAGDLGLVDEGRREFGLLYAPHDFRLAEGALQRALALNPDDMEVLVALAEGYVKTHRSSLAEKHLQHALELEPDNVNVMLGLAEVYVNRGYPAKSVTILRKLLSISPDHFRARLLLGHALIADARMAEAEPELLQCREMRPDHPDPLVGLAACAVERGDAEKAHQLLSQALDLNRNSTRTLNEIGNLQLHQGHYELAVPMFEQVLRSDPNDKQAHLHLAMIYRRTGKMDLAKQHQKRYEELDAEEVERLKKEKEQR
jgi:Flp pilus assembly protein TadD